MTTYTSTGCLYDDVDVESRRWSLKLAYYPSRFFLRNGASVVLQWCGYSNWCVSGAILVRIMAILIVFKKTIKVDDLHDAFLNYSSSMSF